MNHLADAMKHAPGVQVSQLPPLTTLLVWTRNSVYRIVVGGKSSVYVQGGEFFPDPTPARLDGASFGGAVLKAGWIVVGLLMEIQDGNTRIVTSPVRAIAEEAPRTSVVH
jgi:hypothetical protein